MIVNDFGELGIDAALLAGAGTDGVIDLPNGCVCCTIATGLRDTLELLTARQPPVEQVMVEASGVADPAAVAAWAHTGDFRPGGVVVVAAADTVRRQAEDRLIGREIRRQLLAADLVYLSKTDRVAPDEVVAVREWTGQHSGGAPVVTDPGAVLGALLGPHPPPTTVGSGHDVSYRTSSWRAASPVSEAALDRFLDGLPASVLRVKGWVSTTAGDAIEVQVVGRAVSRRAGEDGLPGSQLSAIGLDDLVHEIWGPLTVDE